MQGFNVEQKDYFYWNSLDKPEIVEGDAVAEDIILKINDFVFWYRHYDSNIALLSLKYSTKVVKAICVFLLALFNDYGIQYVKINGNRWQIFQKLFNYNICFVRKPNTDDFYGDIAQAAPLLKEILEKK